VRRSSRRRPRRSGDGELERSQLARLGGAWPVVLLALFHCRSLTLLECSKRYVRWIAGAIGWSRGRVVRQIWPRAGHRRGVASSACRGAVICLIIGGSVLPQRVEHGLAVGASKVSGCWVRRRRPRWPGRSPHGNPFTPHDCDRVRRSSLGGLIAGAVGGWRAARLAPASALRDLG